MINQNDEDLMNPKEAAAYLGCGRQKVYVMLRSESLPGGFKFGGEWKVHRPTLEEWIQSLAKGELARVLEKREESN